jgi:hypothetical protein|tara:strand:+ start:58 stop:669 length:612 start_codon:yes stop_codon:yes gene_type:complete
MMDVDIKNTMQRHLWKEFSYSHRIDIEPTPSSPLQWSALHQRIRKINFDLNKKYHRTKLWTKWKLADRFWFLGAKEGGYGTGSELHYHLLLHTPKNHHIQVWSDLYWGWMKGSPIINSRRGADRRVRGGALENGGKLKTIKVHQVRKPTFVRHKDKFHLPMDDVGWKSVINVERIRNNPASTIYATKKMDRLMENPEGFICII